MVFECHIDFSVLLYPRMKRRVLFDHLGRNTSHKRKGRNLKDYKSETIGTYFGESTSITIIFSFTTAPAAIRDPFPTTAPFRTVLQEQNMSLHDNLRYKRSISYLFMPIRQSSSMVQPCTTALCPTVTPEWMRV